ncbi:MAG: leucyl aminopeptidase family protein [Pseudomonadota bacterium]
MTHPAFTTDAASGIGVYLMSEADWQAGQGGLSHSSRTFAESLNFKGKADQLVIVPDADGKAAEVIFGAGKAKDRLATAGLAAKLVAGTYEIRHKPDAWTMDHIAAGWADGAYRFDRYKEAGGDRPQLILKAGDAADAASIEADSIAFLRDLVNTPAQDMGPEAIENECRTMAAEFGADIAVTVGPDLIDENYPMIHAVGRAGPQPPRLVELVWGDESHRELALVGKGVTFDTGGLNLKTGNYMRLMKKDMGGSAHAAALARLVMAHKLPVRLKLYIPTVENSISGNAFRPGDILQSRKGLSVEIDNTDAEGRLILGDALTRACETKPDLLIDFATLTGAARVALGPDLAPFYTDEDELAAALVSASAETGDPVWRMPLWAPYRSMLNSPIADIVNAGGPQAGSITAAIFLKQFVEDDQAWMHFDIWAWRLAKYGRPEGAAACGLRAVFKMLQSRYG